MTIRVRGRRDPVARRAAILTAAAELITEVGVDAITHRMVAARAQVPLGSTTQYFSSLDELRIAALQYLVSHVDEQLSAAQQVFAESGASPQALAEFIHRTLSDAMALQADRAVVTAALHDPRLREIAAGWERRIIDFLAADYGQERATAASVFINGILVHAQIHEEPLDLALITSGLADLLGEPTGKTI